MVGRENRNKPRKKNWGNSEEAKGVKKRNLLAEDNNRMEKEKKKKGKRSRPTGQHRKGPPGPNKVLKKRGRGEKITKGEKPFMSVFKRPGAEMKTGTGP